MAVKLSEVAQARFDETQSHIRVERMRSGGFAVLGAIGHPDLTDMTIIPEQPFRGREQAVARAVEFAEYFGLPQVVVIV